MAKTDSANRDIASSIHPYTNLKTHETEGPLVITEGDGVFVPATKTARPIWNTYTGLLVRQPGIFRAASGGGGLSADAQAAFLSHLCP